MADFYTIRTHTKQQYTKKKHQNHDRKTRHGTAAGFVFFCRLNMHLSSFHFLPRKFYCIRVARIKRPHRTSTGAGHVLMGLPLIYGSPPRRRARNVPGRAPLYTPLLELRTRTKFSIAPGTSYLPTDSQMLDAWVSFLRHSLGHFPEGNLAIGIIE